MVSGLTTLFALISVLTLQGVVTEVRATAPDPRISGEVTQSSGSSAATLPVATSAANPPIEYISGTQIIGYDIDLMDALVAEMSTTVVYTSVAFSGILTGLVEGRYDAVIATVSVSPEREAVVDFTLPYLNIDNEPIAIAVQQGDDLLRGQLYEALQQLRADGMWDTIVAAVAADKPEWQVRLPDWPFVPVTTTYWHHNTGAREEYVSELIDEFNTTNPYSITAVGEYVGRYSETYDKIIDGLENDGVLPNVVVAYPNSFADFARYGGVRFLDDYFTDPTIGISDTADFFSGVLDYYRLGEYGDQLAGIQNGRSIEVMFYNAGLLTAEGLDVPATWSASETACISITSETISGTIVGSDASRFSTWLWPRGGELLSEDLNTARFNEQPGIDSLALFQHFINDGYARWPLWTYEQLDAFGNGQVGFTFGSSAGLPYYRDAMNNGADDIWGVTHVPAVPGNEVVSSYGAGQGVLHHHDVADRASWLFTKWLAESEQTARWAAVSGYFPVRVSAAAHVSMTEKLADDPQ